MILCRDTEDAISNVKIDGENVESKPSLKVDGTTYSSHISDISESRTKVGVLNRLKRAGSHSYLASIVQSIFAAE